jgi:type IV pilus assembly protein PilA
MGTRGRRAFTLVELMITVAIVGVLAALAVYGVRKHLRQAKTAEAKSHVSGITRGAVAAYERETTDSELVSEGANASGNNQDVCNTASDVPANVPFGNKYQPRTTDGKDFETGGTQAGWKCVRFSVTDPIYFRLTYKRGTATQVAPANPATVAGSSKAFEAAAEGDLDADGVTSKYVRTGKVNLATQQMVISTHLYIENDGE